ncbi:5-(carboxyamino)imidazole ribonucleotide synthase [Paracraurococcus ruber]|uniref:N5-carboxyaminoimidazole ribonucleotide synthase n=1 Tax=Paracraurococcus ruber TaxID=77675 RepID=A0ABS1CZ06_9PROT|nr:5-(carboxyamino)imidazole ribonucleotide synthase [Paracraurococcus ruber]MBK1659742.1 5-(carboxyamino)imidazole ribonucleotide synthase [Paracraurococcus ruber]TDG28207.1 5-(carboxyamino)imidazole ribonucleotide synthase [Paracraurococcus ruber]
MTGRFPLPPGATIGILGGGQLGRMSALAAARLGYRSHVYAPEADSPGMQVAAAAIVAPYEDAAALARFAAAVDVVTFEFENVPAETLAALEPLAPCRPGVEVLRVCQDRLREKAFLEAAGVPVAPWRAVHGEADLAAAIAAIGLPAVLKTTRLGYDGRGQAVLRSPEDAGPAFARLSPKPLILEAFVPFAAEVSAIAARGADGAAATYDAVENRHRDHILDLSFAPARLPAPVAAAARRHAGAVAEALGLVGVLALEMFVLPDGTLLGNEIAPRPHNSGHWTMDGCAASQFEQHVRAVAGLPLADPSRHHDVVMRNLVGPEGMARWPDLLRSPGVVPHLYGKSEARPGRKIGHANRLLPLGMLAGMPDEATLKGL